MSVEFDRVRSPIARVGNEGVAVHRSEGLVSIVVVEQGNGTEVCMIDSMEYLDGGWYLWLHSKRSCQ
jgi:hypothetical protein